MKKESVIIGSAAIKYHFSDFRNPKDIDILIRKEDFLKKTIKLDEEIESIKESNNGLSAIVKFADIPLNYEYLFADGQKSLEVILDALCDTSDYAPIEVLYSLKKGHIHFPVKFNKHIKDLEFLRGKIISNNSIILPDYFKSSIDLADKLPALTELHFKETEKRLGKLRTPKMNQTTEQFFGKSKKYVKSYYIHDNMHLAVAHLDDGPIYKLILKDGSEVETVENKWRNLNLLKKTYCVLEEVYVIALERKILPSLFGDLKEEWTPRQAFDWALMRVCTTLCDGFFREFAVRGYELIQTYYDKYYVEKFFNKISNYEKDEEIETGERK
jgi:hypothetical protein